MPAEIFLDLNVMIYVFSGTGPEKRDRARALLEMSGVWISTQVVNELTNVMVRTFQQPISTIRQAIEQMVTVVKIHVVGMEGVRRAKVSCGTLSLLLTTIASSWLRPSLWVAGRSTPKRCNMANGSMRR